MDNPLSGSINIDHELIKKIGFLLKRLRQPSNPSNVTLRETRECLAQMVDWVEAIFTDAQIREAVALLGQRTLFSRPPAFCLSTRHPMGTILSHSAETKEKL